MKASSARIWRHCLFEADAGVIKYRLVNVKRRAVRVQHHDQLWYGIDNLPKLSFRLLDLFECHRQGRLRSIALDSDSGDAARVIDQLDFARPRMPDLAVIHTEGA